MMHRYRTIISSGAILVALGIVSMFSFYFFSVNACKASEPNVGKAGVRFEQYVKSLYESVGLKKQGLDLEVFRYALIGYYNLQKENVLIKKGIISIIDYRKSCNDKRLFVIDLRKKKLIFHTLVAHGKNTGDVYARHFSNKPDSLQSSLGFFVTGETFSGEHGYSLYLEGIDQGFNDNAKSRALIIHGAYYVSKSFVKKYGKIGRSWGCPALPAGLHLHIIDTIKGGTCLFQFYDDKHYLKSSIHLDVAGAYSQFENEDDPICSSPPR